MFALLIELKKASFRGFSRHSIRDRAHLPFELLEVLFVIRVVEQRSYLD